MHLAQRVCLYAGPRVRLLSAILRTLSKSPKIAPYGLRPSPEPQRQSIHVRAWRVRAGPLGGGGIGYLPSMRKEHESHGIRRLVALLLAISRFLNPWRG